MIGPTVTCCCQYHITSWLYQVAAITGYNVKPAAKCEACSAHMLLACCWLQCVDAACRAYRKTVLAGMPSLHHLDDMPVTAKERRLAIAYMQGGLQVCFSALFV